jgi:5-methylcytosine-specific restriction enzyme subunit McrC
VITHTVTESSSTELSISDADAVALRRIGRQLASDKSWWGSDSDEQDQIRSVVRCEQGSAGRYRVRIADAIGVLGLPNCQIQVVPKIPIDHLLFLLSKGERIPRLTNDATQLASASTFHDLIARWFVIECERLIRRGLRRDYRTTVAQLGAVRGSVIAVPTATSLMLGRPRVRCRFSDFDHDTPLNRLLRGAAESIVRSNFHDSALRRRSARLATHLSDASNLTPSDLRASPDSSSTDYSNAIVLAKAVLRSSGASLNNGPQSGGTFLFRTPEGVEEGLRRVIAEALPDAGVRKEARVLGGSRRRTVNPDLVFQRPAAVGDVKYSELNGEFKRSHLYQLATFALAYEVDRGLLVGFAQGVEREQVMVGRATLDVVCWNTAAASPTEAAQLLAEELSSWVAGQARWGGSLSSASAPRGLPPNR